uniref:Uncharacterized protein n=1 Tax=Trypanosoma vivax (strain Y486) TaxID=1055687 RepID=G0UCV2_TRYVY|nr:hypothetical protein TVY486_1111460 [Trypanosoma vivax Y486]
MYVEGWRELPSSCVPCSHNAFTFPLQLSTTSSQHRRLRIFATRASPVARRCVCLLASRHQVLLWERSMSWEGASRWRHDAAPYSCHRRYHTFFFHVIRFILTSSDICEHLAPIKRKRRKRVVQH